MTLRLDHIPGSPSVCGRAHGERIRDLVEPAFLERYIGALSDAIGFDQGQLRSQGMAWLGTLPDHFVTEIEAMAHGAGVTTGPMVDLLFADIAPARDPDAPVGPICSAVTSRLNNGGRWVGRNCDWLTPTLTRGVSAVVHEVPGRIPVMAVGIRGDIDVDTGLNAEGLWVHLHTMYAADPVPGDRACISWLFWAREALETCATLDELERFIGATARDRGVMVIACEGRTGDAALFTCSRGSYTRHGALDGAPLCVTNHPPRSKDLGAPPGSPNASGTISRFRTLQRLIDERPPDRGPDDIVRALSATGVEMRTPTWIRTIYSAVADTQNQCVWFASGTPGGLPAASTGTWDRITPPWVSRPGA